MENHTAVNVNTETDLKEPYEKVIIIGKNKANAGAQIIQLKIKQNVGADGAVVPSSVQKWVNNKNIMTFTNFYYSDMHTTTVDDEYNIWIIGGSNELLNDISNNPEAALKTQKQFVSVYRQPSKVPEQDEVLIIDLSYSNILNNIKKKDVIVKYKPHKPPKLAGYSITWTSTNFSDTLKNIPQWNTNPYLGNYKAISDQYWCKNWNNNNYFHFNNDFVPTLYIENNGEEMFLNKIFLNLNEATNGGANLAKINMADVLSVANDAARASNLKGKKGEPNFSDGNPGMNGKDKDFNLYYLEDINRTQKTYSNAVKFDIEKHKNGNIAPWYNILLSGNEVANAYKEWDEVEELIKEYLVEY